MEAWIGYVVLFIVFVVLLFGVRFLLKREQQRADVIDMENRRLNAVILDKVIPALENATEVNKVVAEALRKFRER